MAISKRRITIKLEFVGAGTQDLNFNDSSITYLGQTLNDSYNEMFINNQSNFNLYYSVESDPADAITVDDTATEGVMPVIRKGAMSEINSQIDRLRVTLEGAGDVYIILYHNPRALL